MARKDDHRTDPKTSATRRLLRVLLWLSLTLVLVVSAVYILGETACRSSDRSRFIELYGSGLRGYEETILEEHGAEQELQVILEGSGDLQVIAGLRRPVKSASRLPALLLLGGFRTGRHSIDFIPPTEGLVLLAIDYPYTGKKSGLSALEFVTALPAMRRAVLDTVPAAMMAVDYLVARPEVDAERIVLVAGSVGALFAPSIAATDTRIAGTALLFGGGDIQSLLAANIRQDLGWLTGPASWLGKILTCPVEPLHHIGAISPRPVFMLNGTEDLGIPNRNTRLLFDAANEPKHQRWIDAGHVVLQDRQFHALVSDELAAWLTAQGFIPRDPFVATQSAAQLQPDQ